METARPRRTPSSAIALASAGTVVSVLPAFLTGAMAVQLTENLAFGVAALGVAVGAFWGAGALTSAWLGRLVDRLGASRSMQIAGAISAASMGGIALSARSWAALVVWLVIGSMSHVIAQPAANRLLMNAVDPARLGVSFGIKQSAPPLASSLAGISVPLLALTLGWRYAYAIGAVCSIAVVIAAGRGGSQRPRPAAVERAAIGPRPELLLFGLAFGLAVSATSSVPAFYVDAAVVSGLSPSRAGTMLGIAAFLTIAGRLVSGVLVDRLTRRHLLICAVQLSFAVVGLGLLALARPVTMTVGVVVAMALGWSFNGVFWFSMVRAHPKSPGAITGTIAPAGLLANTVSPLLFGSIAEQFGYRPAWLTAAGIATLAVVAFVAGSRRLERATPTH
ncbi:MAG: MFS transporter [Nitriliruptoraceae bacterium]